MGFKVAEKTAAFDLIAKRYFDRNFGTMSKTDFETLLFHIYMENLLSHNEKFDDYTVSKALGISQSKVRNLKMRKELQYPHQYPDGLDWKNEFVKALDTAAYDKETHLVSMLISEPVVMVELRYFLESNGGFDIRTLNSKQFVCRVDHLVMLFEKLSEENIELEDDRKNKLKQLEAKGMEKSAIEKICTGAYEDGLKKLVLEGSKQALTEVLKLIPFGGLAATAVEVIIKLIEQS